MWARAVKSRFNNKGSRRVDGVDAGLEPESITSSRNPRSAGGTAGDERPLLSANIPYNTPQTLNYSRRMRRFKEPQFDRLATLTKTGPSLISRDNCAR
jgi:hypothetical protein